MPHVTAKVVDSKDNIVPCGERGELLIAGYNSFLGYWANPEKTAEILQKDADGRLWLRTGDEVAIDREGYCRVTGRMKDIIIRGRLLAAQRLLLTTPTRPALENLLTCPA